MKPHTVSSAEGAQAQAVSTETGHPEHGRPPHSLLGAVTCSSGRSGQVPSAFHSSDRMTSS